MKQTIKLFNRLTGVSEKFQFVAALITRATIAEVFIESGWGKLHHLDKVTDFFRELGIPAAQIQAPFAASMELLCGILVAVGLATRLASVPLIIIMCVAIRTAKWDDVTGFSSLVEISEYLYIVALAWLATHGAGVFSLDYLLKRRFSGRRH